MADLMARRKQIREANILIVEEYAEKHNITTADSLEDWVNEGEMDLWLILALEEHFNHQCPGVNRYPEDSY